MVHARDVYQSNVPQATELGCQFAAQRGCPSLMGTSLYIEQPSEIARVEDVLSVQHALSVNI